MFGSPWPQFAAEVASKIRQKATIKIVFEENRVLINLSLLINSVVSVN